MGVLRVDASRVSDRGRTLTGSLLDAARLRWIESWANGWRNALSARYGDKDYYAELPLDVAVSMIEELSVALRSPEQAFQLLAHELHESGEEIGEYVERLRFEALPR